MQVPKRKKMPTNKSENLKTADDHENGLKQPEENQPAQGEMPFAMVEGAPVTDMPRDLYIPPDALEVFLEAFEGPLDLLLYLIKRQNLDILNIPVAEITRQYMEYIDLMKDLRLELAAEYLLMAAMLAEIKSRLLLPRPAGVDEDEDDPRAELVRRLQEYEQFKTAAEDMNSLERLQRDVHQAHAEMTDLNIVKIIPDITLKELMIAFKDAMTRAEMYSHHHIQREALSVRDRMADILANMRDDSFHEFSTLFTVEEGRMGVVVTFIAILELLKESLIEIVQNDLFGRIHLKAAGVVDDNDLDSLESEFDEA